MTPNPALALALELPAPELVPPTVSRALADALHDLGVRQVFGVMGGAVANVFRALATSDLRCVHTRHEAGAGFAAVEASLATDRPVVVFTTAGPGITNAITGMLAGRWEGAQVILISACNAARHRGRIATQETTAATMGGAGVFLDGGAFHYATVIEHAAQLPSVVNRLAAGLARPHGFVAHLSIPQDVQTARAARVRPPLPPPAAAVSREVAAHHAELLARERPAIWIGYGARRAAPQIRRLAERLGAMVLCTPRAKGIFPEDHPQFIGASGLGGHGNVDEVLLANRPAYTLVLGTRLGESSTFWADELTPREAFIHVDTDGGVIGAAYPHVTTHPVVADVGVYVDALLDELDVIRARPAPLAAALPPPPRLTPRSAPLVRPQLLLQEMQDAFVDPGDTWLMAESGNSFCWSTHLWRFREPGQYRVSTGFGSMGHAATGVVGAALARNRKAVALLGDGAMLMLSEIHTAVQTGAPAVWVVLNDACYLMCSQGMQMMGWQPFSCELPPVDFVALARSLGADGIRVERESDVAAALALARAAGGPFVVDVAVDPAEIPPSGRRNKSLMQQGTDTGGGK